MTAVKSRSVSGVDQDADAMVDILRRLKSVEQLAHRHPAPIDNGYKNYFINPYGQVNQGGIGAYSTLTGAGLVYGCDQWAIFRDGTGGTTTLGSGVLFSPGNEVLFEGVDFDGGLICNQTVAPTGQTYCQILQPIEGVKTLAGQLVTLSFWTLTAVAITTTANVGQVFGTGGSPSASVFTQLGGTVVSTAGNWKKMVYTGVIPSISGKTIGTNKDDYLQVTIQLGAGFINAATYFYLIGLQLERGPVPTIREYRPPQVELALCQRYWFVRSNAGANQPFATGQVFVTGASANAGIVHFELPVPLRKTPTINATAAGTFYVWAANSAGVVLTAAPSFWNESSDHQHIGLWFGVGAGLVSGNVTQLVSFTAGATVTFNARLI